MTMYEYELDEFEYEDEDFLGDLGGLFGEFESPLSEEEELEFAQELLEITDEAELEEFLGKVFKKVGRSVGKFVKSPIGKSLGGILKKVAKTALPAVGGAIGSFVAPGVGTALGSKLGSMATKLFELEYEAGEMDEAELELEVARRVVRLAATSAKNAATAPAGANPKLVAKKAVMKAAKTQAPRVAAIVNRQPVSQRPVPGRRSGTGSHSGRWVRRGSTLVLYGA